VPASVSMAAAQRTPPGRVHLKVVTDDDVLAAASAAAAARKCPSCGKRTCKHWPGGPAGLELQRDLLAPPPAPARFSWAAAVPILSALLGWAVALRPPRSPRPKTCRPRHQFPLPAGPRRAGARKTALSSRPRSIGNARLTRKERVELAAARAELAGVYRRRPKSYADCLKRKGPCGFVSCRHNLFLEVDYRVIPPVVKLNFPGMDIDEIPETCSLKVADEREGPAPPGRARPEAFSSLCTGDGHTQERVGELLNITDGWVQQFEVQALAKVREALEMEDRGTDDEDDDTGDDGTEEDAG